MSCPCPSSCVSSTLAAGSFPPHHGFNCQALNLGAPDSTSAMHSMRVRTAATQSALTTFWLLHAKSWCISLVSMHARRALIPAPKLHEGAHLPLALKRNVFSCPQTCTSDAFSIKALLILRFLTYCASCHPDMQMRK